MRRCRDGRSQLIMNSMARAILFLFSVSAFAQAPLAVVSAAITGAVRSVSVRDSAGTDRTADVVAVSNGQISFVIPSATAQGQASVTIARQGSAFANSPIGIARLAPGLFTADASGAGAPAGFVLQITNDGTRSQDNLFETYPGQSAYETRPFDTAITGAETYLILFGTGLRAAPLSSIAARIDNTPVPVLAAQAQSEFPGLDQVNLGPLP